MAANSVWSLLPTRTTLDDQRPFIGLEARYTIGTPASQVPSNSDAFNYLPLPWPVLTPLLSPEQLTSAARIFRPSRLGSHPSTSVGYIHPVTRRLYQCAVCYKRYSQLEHLTRHVQSFTLGKRFFCQVCGKAFARSDLLEQHAANHENDRHSARKRSRADASPAAGRVSYACRPCAHAKVKCEKLKPCTRCRNRNLHCEFNLSEAGSAAIMHGLQLSQGSSNEAGPISASFEAVTLSPQLPFESPAQPEDSQGLTILDFCDDAYCELAGVNIGLLDHLNLDRPVHSQVLTRAVTPHTVGPAVDMI